MKFKWFSFLSILGLSLAFAGSAIAGPGRGKGRMDREFPPKDMVKDLKLTDDQVKSLKSLHEKHMTEAKSEREKMKALRDSLRTAMEKDSAEPDLWKEFDTVQGAKQNMAKMWFNHILEVRKILTPEQRKQFRGMMDKKRGGHHGRGGDDSEDGPPFGGPPSDDE